MSHDHFMAIMDSALTNATHSTPEQDAFLEGLFPDDIPELGPDDDDLSDLVIYGHTLDQMSCLGE